MSEALALMPWPRRVTRTETPLELNAPEWTVTWLGVRTLRLERTATRLTQRMARYGGGGATLAIDCAAASAPYADLDDDESYSLKIDAAHALLTAATEWGVLRGLATLAQLTGKRRTLPGVLIADTPRFAWRGLMVDSARHFISVATLLRTLDAMALVKLNVLHLHLTDDQGFRFSSRAFPELAERASGDDCYTEDDLGEIVSHAAELGIRVVPEIDMPGHTTSWLVAHPEWGTTQEARVVSARFGPHSACLDPTRDEVYEALGRLFDECGVRLDGEHLEAFAQIVLGVLTEVHAYVVNEVSIHRSFTSERESTADLQKSKPDGQDSTTDRRPAIFRSRAIPIRAAISASTPSGG